MPVYMTCNYLIFVIVYELEKVHHITGYHVIMA